MPSPFPGMNPYLEQSDVWHDFHEAILPLIREDLVRQVRPEFIVQLDQHIYIHELPEERRFIGRSDIYVAQAKPESEPQSSTAILEAPHHGRVPITVDFE